MSVQEFPGKVALKVSALHESGCIQCWYSYIDREKDSSWGDVYARMGQLLGMLYDSSQGVLPQVTKFLLDKGFKSPSVYWIDQKEIDLLTDSWDTVNKGEPQLGIPGPDQHYRYFEED